MSIKSRIKRRLLGYKKNIVIDNNSEINYNVINNSKNSKYPCQIFDSKCSFQSINEGCDISEIRSYGDVNLGRFVSITGPGTVIKSLKKSIHIGSFSSIGQNVCIVDFNHFFERVSSSFINYSILNDEFSLDIKSKGPVVLEEDVWVGSNTVILSGVRIGRGSVIGAGTVVTKDIPRYSIAFGSPAKVHSKRFSDNTIRYLEELKWWEWSVEKIVKNRSLFMIDLNRIDVSDLK